MKYVYDQNRDPKRMFKAFRQKKGEFGYTARAVSALINELVPDELSVSVYKVTDYAKKHKLLVSYKDMGIKKARQCATAYLISQRNVLKVMNGLKISARSDDLEQAALELHIPWPHIQA